MDLRPVDANGFELRRYHGQGLLVQHLPRELRFPCEQPQLGRNFQKLLDLSAPRLCNARNRTNTADFRNF